MIGKSLGHYRITAPLGQGGMGEVWIAEDTRLHRNVALKTLPRELAADPGRRARFEREAQAIAALNHPNIVTIYSVEELDGVGFIVMELVDGTTLRELIPSNGLPLDRFLEIAIPLADALAAANQQGIAHRDLKPENVMVNAEGRVKVLDFGLAKLLAHGGAARDAGQETATQATAVGTVLGTAGYMSPEQAEGRPVDTRSDLFSLGVLFYEMATGRRPFTGDSPARLISSILRDDPPALQELRPDYPGELGAILQRCLEKEPERRVQTASDTRNQLQAQRRQPSSASGVSTPQTFPGDRTRAALVIALPLLAIVLAAVGAWYLGDRGSLEATSQQDSVRSASPFAARKLSQLTFEAAPERWPAWSPDGAAIVYCHESDGYSKLFVKELSNGGSRQVTHGSRDDIQPAWSPDGESLVFVRAATDDGKLEPSEVLSGDYSDGDVWRLDLESGEETRILEEAFNPAFSPDGTKLAFDASKAGPRRIWTTDARGHNPRQITTDTSEAVQHTRPAWSPDGKRLVYLHAEKTRFDIEVFDLTSATTTRVTDDLYLDLDPLWSPSGAWIYLSSYRGGGLNIWRVPVTAGGSPTGPPEQVTTGAGQDIHPDLAADGTRLAFTVLQQNADLWQLPTDPMTGARTGDPQPLVTSTREDSRGAWSPDGGLLAFNSDRDGEMNLWIHSPEDGSTRPLTRGPGGDYQPKWSPDGSSIAFFSARSGNADVWTVEVESGELRRITDHPALDTNPFFSPDGKRIAFQSDRDGRKEVWWVEADGGNPRQLASVGVRDHFMRWSPDGASLYFLSSSLADNSICRLDVESGEVEPTGIPVGWHMSFSPDQSLILDAVGHRGIWVYPLDGSERREVFLSEDPDVRVDYPDWSADGRRVVYDRVVPRGGDVWLLEGLD